MQGGQRIDEKTTTTNKPLAFITVDLGITRKSATLLKEFPFTAEKLLGIVMFVMRAVEFSLTT